MSALRYPGARFFFFFFSLLFLSSQGTARQDASRSTRKHNDNEPGRQVGQEGFLASSTGAFPARRQGISVGPTGAGAVPHIVWLVLKAQSVRSLAPKGL